jgi:hypothetical protein
VPPVVIERAAATLPLLPPAPVRLAAASNGRDSTPESQGEPTRPPSIKDIKNPVTLTVQVEGRHLQHARSCSARIHGVSAPLVVRLMHTEPHLQHPGLVQVQQPSQTSHSTQPHHRPLAGALQIQSFARLVGRQATGAAARHSKAGEAAGHCTVIAEVTLPRAALDALSSAAHEHLQAQYERQQKAAAAAAAQRGHVLWRRAQQLRSVGAQHRARSAAVVSTPANDVGVAQQPAPVSAVGNQQQQEAGSLDTADLPKAWLELSFVSDFSEAHVPVSLEPRRAALIGSSPGAAALLQAALATQSGASNIVPAPAQWMARSGSSSSTGLGSAQPASGATQQGPASATSMQAPAGRAAAGLRQWSAQPRPAGWRVMQAGSSFRQLAGSMLTRDVSPHSAAAQPTTAPDGHHVQSRGSSPPAVSHSSPTPMLASGGGDTWDVQQDGALTAVHSTPPALALPAVAAAAAAAAASGVLTADPMHTAGATATAAALAAALVSGAGGASAQGSTPSSLPIPSSSSAGVAPPQVLQAPSLVAGDEEKPMKSLQAPPLVDGPPLPQPAATSPATSSSSSAPTTPRAAPRTLSWTMWRSPFHQQQQQPVQQSAQSPAPETITSEQPQSNSMAVGAVTGAARLASAGSKGLATHVEALAVPALVAAGAVLPSRQWSLWRPWTQQQQQEGSPGSLASFAIDRLDSTASTRSSTTEAPSRLPLAVSGRTNSLSAHDASFAAHTPQGQQGVDSKQATQPAAPAGASRGTAGLRPLAAVRNQLSMLVSMAQQWQAAHVAQQKVPLPPSILLDSGLVLTNVQQLSPATSPFVLLRALAAALRRQVRGGLTGWWVQATEYCTGPPIALR